MKQVLTTGDIKTALDNIVVTKLHRSRGDVASRAWHITFTNSYNGVYGTVLCELQGTPVRATILANVEAAPSETALLLIPSQYDDRVRRIKYDKNSKKLLEDLASLRTKTHCDPSSPEA